MTPQRQPVSHAERLRRRHERVRAATPAPELIVESVPQPEDEAEADEAQAANRFAGFMGCAP